jgi:DNA-3-methyladenine glycosylase
MEEESEVRLVTHDSLRDEEIIRTTRVGITQAMDVPWRFYIKGNPYISRR